MLKITQIHAWLGFPQNPPQPGFWGERLTCPMSPLSSNSPSPSRNAQGDPEPPNSRPAPAFRVRSASKTQTAAPHPLPMGRRLLPRIFRLFEAVFVTSPVPPEQPSPGKPWHGHSWGDSLNSNTAARPTGPAGAAFVPRGLVTLRNGVFAEETGIYFPHGSSGCIWHLLQCREVEKPVQAQGGRCKQPQ